MKGAAQQLCRSLPFPYFSGTGKTEVFYGLEKMTEQEEIEKLYLYCMGELRILIENPYEYNDLLERLSSVKNTLEYLYVKTIMKKP